jgi:hypothetical protein
VAFGHGGAGGHGGGGGHSGGGSGHGYGAGYQRTYGGSYWGVPRITNWTGSGPAWSDPTGTVGFPEDLPLNRLHRFFVHTLPHLHPNANLQQ